MAKPKPPPPPRPQLRAGDVVVLRQSQQDVKGEIITVLEDGRYKVHWLTGSDYRDRVTTVTPEEIRRKPRRRCNVWLTEPVKRPRGEQLVPPDIQTTLRGFLPSST